MLGSLLKNVRPLATTSSLAVISEEPALPAFPWGLFFKVFLGLKFVRIVRTGRGFLEELEVDVFPSH